jgi:hypothetical protein
MSDEFTSGDVSEEIDRVFHEAQSLGTRYFSEPGNRDAIRAEFRALVGEHHRLMKLWARMRADGR